METIVETLTDICRICLKQDDTVFHNLEDYLEIVEAISQIQVSLNEEYPEKICSECTKHLTAANEIRNLIIQSNGYFVKNDSCSEEYVDFKTENQSILEQEIFVAKDLMDYTVMEEVVVEEPNEEIKTDMLYRCCICDEIFDGLQAIENHCEEIHKRYLTKNDGHKIERTHCLVCNRDFNKIDNRHRTCMHCDKFLATPESFLMHAQKKSCKLLKTKTPRAVNTVKASKQYGCCKCSLIFETHQLCKSHFDAEHIDDIYTGKEVGAVSCDYCLAPFTLTDLKKHLKAPRLKVYICDHCKEELSSFPKYSQHIEEMHSNKTQFECNECDKIYESTSSLRYHMYLQHNPNNHRLCPDCGKVFKKKVSFMEHRNIHLGLRPHICSLCKCGFTSTGALRLIH